EDDEDPYRFQPPNISPEKAKELEDERREVIRGQVVRKSSTMAEKWSSMDELSSINAGGQGDGRHGVPSGFALYFDKPSGRAATPVDPESIDREQINFSAARQQFLMLEKSSPGSLFSPGQHAASPKPELVAKTSRQEWQSPDTATKAERGDGNTGGPGQSRADRSSYQVYSVSHQAPGKEEVYARWKNDTNGGDGSAKGSGETPIEREIRRALEREESLWKERGIQRPTSSSELVEIQTKPLLSVDLSPAQGRKGKDKGRASFYVQREIEKETKREEDLRRQGRLPGLYDRGTQQELDERRRVFEQEEGTQPKPFPARKADEWRSWELVEQTSTHGQELNDGGHAGKALSSFTVNLTRSGAAAGERGRDESLLQERASVDAGKWAREDSMGGRLPSPTPSPVLRREHFSFSYWKPRISFVEGMGTQNPARREEGRDEQYTLRTWKPQRSVLIEEEIRSDLQREEELQEQRRRRWLMDGGDGSSREGSRSRHSSAASGASGSYSVAGSPVFAPASHQTGVLALAASFTPLRLGSIESLGPDSSRSSPFEERRRRTKEEGKVVESTRVGRHQSAMGRCWEIGRLPTDSD
ncbi:MISP protein, partial [Penelope pileata]|nr:MISP protein [Penelope pileata]